MSADRLPRTAMDFSPRVQRGPGRPRRRCEDQEYLGFGAGNIVPKHERKKIFLRQLCSFGKIHMRPGFVRLIYQTYNGQIQDKPQVPPLNRTLFLCRH